MASCELIANCKFYNGKMTNMPANADSYKENYCNKNSLHCAIYLITEAKDADAVPNDILPDQKDRAYQIIGS